MSDSTVIIAALKQLDTKNDDHWTSDKKPAMAAIELLAKDKSITRGDVDSVAEGFNRDTASAFFIDVGKPWETPAAADTPPADSDVTVAQEAAPLSRQEGASEADEAAEGGEGGPNASDVTAEQSEMGSNAICENELETLEEDLRTGEEHLAQLSVVQDRITNEKLKIEQAMDTIRARIDKLTPNNEPTLVIQDYLESQKRIGQQRGANRAALASSGINLKVLQQAMTKSPIDQAFARKNGRGAQRPTRV